MKLFLIVAVIGFVAAVQADDDKREALRKVCMSESKVEEEIALKARNGEFQDDSTELKKYIRCIFVKVGAMNEKGELQYDAIRARIPGDVNTSEATKVIEDCKSEIVENDDTETAYRVFKCYRKSVYSPIQF